MSEIEVKALEWSDEAGGEYIAQSVIGWFHIGRPASYWNLTTPHGGVSSHETLESAKDAAQSNCDARIRSAIVERKAEPVAWQWCAYEDGSQRTSWYPEGDSYQAGWEELAKKYPDKYQVVTRPLYSTPPAVPARVPEGWQLVPREPTQEMLAAVTAADQQEPFSDKTMRGVFVEMLSASPSPVDSRELIERLVKALEEIAASRRMNCHEMSDEERAEYWSALALRYRSIASKALAAKEQQP